MAAAHRTFRRHAFDRGAASPTHAAATSEPEGFSIVELVLVLVVAASLLGLGIRRFHRYAHDYRVATMVSALRRLADAQDAYWRDMGSYASAVASLRYSPVRGAAVIMTFADSLGWSARAAVDGESAVCAIFYGDAPILPPATTQNVIGCSQ